MDKWKHILFWFLFLALCIPMIRQVVPIYHSTKLRASYVKLPRPAWDIESTLSGQFQQKLERFLMHNYEGRPEFVRVHNQVQFWLFRELSLKNYIIGKEDYIFAKGMIAQYALKNRMNEAELEDKVVKLKFIQEALNKRGTPFLLSIAASKEICLFDMLPDEHQITEESTFNYKMFIRLLKKHEVSHIDFVPVFTKSKDTSIVPLFPKSGIHWTTAAGALALDSIVGYLANLNPRKFGKLNFTITDYVFDRKLQNGDADINKAMDLIVDLPEHRLLKPIIEVSELADKPNAFVIGDSYFWPMVQSTVPSKIFARDSRFSFYYKNAYTLEPGNGDRWPMHNLDYEEFLERPDLVLMTTSPNTLIKFGYDFIEDAYAHLSGDSSKTILQIEHALYSDSVTLKSIKDEASAIGQPLEEHIRKLALEEWQFNR